MASLGAGASVLEIGSGLGAFDSICPGYIALDILFRALRNFSTGRRVQASAEAIPFADASVDAVFTIASLEHVPNPERSLAEIESCSASPGEGADLSGVVRAPLGLPGRCT